MRRREFIRLFGGAAATWPLAARAQQTSAPVVGFLSAVSRIETAHLVAAFQRGLTETGFTEGKNVAIEYQFAEGHYDRLPAQAAELVRRPVDVIVASAPPAANAARTATTTIPIIFIVGLDPVAAGLVASFNRPGGNATGISLASGPLGQKRLELVREFAPKAKTVAMLVNPLGPDAAPEIRDMQAAAQANGLEIRMLNASTPSELDVALATLADHRAGALLVGADPFFMVRRKEIVALVTRQGIPAVYPFREFPAAGGLMSYGTNIANAYRQAGIYCGRILKGAKPGDLPVLNPTTFELVINLNAARILGLDIPPALHARSDEVIE
ncbi:MAG TPA: ABC transporter substrate-binding protein [Pseudolabrys sp.]|jgi:putative ABC transport system substrate-binding protein|nr:ABC transporter substrate-binding protein [Pseudolabrys sp.]